MALKEIFGGIAGITGGKPPNISLPRWPLFPLAYMAEVAAQLRFVREPMLTVDSLRMSRKHMYFSSAKAQSELGYSFRPANEALREAIDWLRAQKYIL